jgi:hypothetical protein
MEKQGKVTSEQRPTARKFDREVERVVVETQPSVEITMSHEDAFVLQKILCNISGDPYGPRGVSDRISSALEAIGIYSYWNDSRFIVKGGLILSDGTTK